jgi:predicted N-formylglutamate amidohydrolase
MASSHFEPALTPPDAPVCPATRIAGDPAAGVVFLCDHAQNTIPPEYRALGLPPTQLERHIAYDIGAEALTKRLAALFGAPAVMSQFSRLLIDPNRGEDDPTLVMRFSDGAIVPGNARIAEDEVERRIRRFFRPYDEAVSETIEASIKSGVLPVIVSVHSFTPFWRGVPRPWQVGILWASDGRFSTPLIEALKAEGDLTVGDNEPYQGALKGDVIDRHALRRGLSNTLIEVRQDLIADQADVEAWAERLARVMRSILADPLQHSSTVSNAG